MKKRYTISMGFGVLAFGIFLLNASWLAPTPEGELTLLSHRGVHQDFAGTNIKDDTCTALFINTPTHAFIENTIPSMRAAIDAGAGVLELDIHPTTDGEFVVFHDWSLDCRTNGTGRTRDHSLAELKALDVGYGYTSDGGTTFPFRDKFFGAMPTLGEVFLEFGDVGFMINMKSRSRKEARELNTYLGSHNIAVKRIVVYGHPDPIDTLSELNPGLRVWTKQEGQACIIGYLKTGWLGKVPGACHNSWVWVPENYRWAIWGWPNRFQNRLSKVGSRAVLMGPISKARSNPLIDTVEQLTSVPDGFIGIVATNRIEVVGPELVARKSKDDR